VNDAIRPPMLDDIENVIVRNFLFNEEYTRKVLPYIKEEYFTADADKKLFVLVNDFVGKYNDLPTPEIIRISLPKEEVIERLGELEKQSNSIDKQWLLDQTEQWCQEKAIYNAVLKSINILDDKKTNQNKGIIPQLLADAIGVSFDTNLGHDYLEDAEERFAYYHKKENKIQFDIDLLNSVTNGGVTRKTLNLIGAGINVGKSLIQCHLAAAYLSAGYNVVYFTMEMAQEEIAKRIDANLYNMDINDIIEIQHDIYMKRMEKLRAKITGKLIVKEFPTAGAGVIQFRAFLNELNLKKSFRPTVCFFDYIGICMSSRIKMAGNTNTYIESIAQELRGLMQEMEMVGWTATQLTRDGMASSDPDMTDTGSSIGLPATVDFYVIVTTSDELEELMQYQARQVKNRYNNSTKNKRFVIGVDRAKQRLYNVDDSQQNLTGQNQQPVMDTTSFGERDENDGKKSRFLKLITG